MMKPLSDEHFLRVDSASTSPLHAVGPGNSATTEKDAADRFQALWEVDKNYRYHPQVLTELLHEQIPVLGFVRWRVDSVEPGFARTSLPLIAESTNQHCTHQAALLFLSADYTGGIALASLLPGWPAVGVHPLAGTDKSMALWLVKGEIKFLRPSCGRLDVTASVEPQRHARIRKRFLNGKPVVEQIIVQFRNGSAEVAEAVMVYYARQADKLRTDGDSTERINTLYRHKLISSAELIAGIRARESGGLFVDPYAAPLAAEHGMALAERFCGRSPQLGDMIAARTRHLDLAILEFARRGGRDLILLGVGYDMRPFRLDLPSGTRVYELDLPALLADRQKRIGKCNCQEPPGLDRIAVPIDLRSTTVAEVLEDRLDYQSPVFVAWEGMSMYFEEPEVRRILAGIAPVLRHPDSSVWIDFVDEQVIKSPEVYPEVAAFTQGMQMLGEPFIFGTGSVESFLESSGFRCREVVPSNLFFEDEQDPVFSLYRFCTATAAAAQRSESSSADSRRQVHPSHGGGPAEMSNADETRQRVR